MKILFYRGKVPKEKRAKLEIIDIYWSKGIYEFLEFLELEKSIISSSRESELANDITAKKKYIYTPGQRISS